MLMLINLTKYINDSIMKMKIFKFYDHVNENIFCFKNTDVHNYTLNAFSDVYSDCSSCQSFCRYNISVMYVPACVRFGIINFIV